MAESHEAHLGVLTDAEREALERPGLKQRARAVAAATEFATKLGLNEDTLDVLVGRLRELDGPHARLAWKTLGDTNELLEMLFIDGTQVDETPQAITDVLPEVVSEVASEQVVATEQPTPDKGEDWFESKTLDFRRVRKFYKSINDKTEREWLSVPEDSSAIDRDELVGLVALYGARHGKPAVANKQIDALHDNFLAGTESDSYINGLRYTVTNKIAELLDDGSLAVNSVAEPQVEPEVQATPKTVALVESGRKMSNVSIVEMIEQLAAREDVGSSYKVENVEWLFDKLAIRGVDLRLTALDFNHSVLAQLATMYSETATTPEEVIDTNIAIMGCWLLGVEMKDLVYMRTTTKMDAKPQDVHNSKTAFLEGVRKGWERGMRIELSDEPLEDDEEETEVYTLPPAAEVLHSVPPLVEETEDVVEKQERDLDEEPKYVQIAAAYIERLGMSVSKRAFEELLNPDTRGEMVASKALVLEVLKQRIGMVSSDGGIIDQLEVSARAKNAVRQLFGMGYVKHGKVVERDSIVLKDQLRNVTGGDRRAYIEDFYAGLDALLEEIATPEEEPKSSAPARVVFGANGEVRLA